MLPAKITISTKLNKIYKRIKLALNSEFIRLIYPQYEIEISEFIFARIFRILKYTEFLITSHVTTVQKVYHKNSIKTGFM